MSFSSSLTSAEPSCISIPMVARDAESAATETPVPAGPSGFKITFIDVGQGDATLVEVDGELLLIDGGRSKARIRERLQALGVTDLDAIVATHPTQTTSLASWKCSRCSKWNACT